MCMISMALGQFLKFLSLLSIGVPSARDGVTIEDQDTELVST